MIAIALHPYISVPHRIDALDSGLGYIASHSDVRLATGEEIIDHYLTSGAASELLLALEESTCCIRP